MSSIDINKVPYFDESNSYYVGDRVRYKGKIYFATDAMEPSPFRLGKWEEDLNFTALLNQVEQLEKWKDGPKYHEGDILRNSTYEPPLTEVVLSEGKYKSFHPIDSEVAEYIRKLQYQLWMQKAETFEWRAVRCDVIQAEWGSEHIRIKRDRYQHAAKVIRKVAGERYGKHE